MPQEGPGKSRDCPDELGPACWAPGSLRTRQPQNSTASVTLKHRAGPLNPAGWGHSASARGAAGCALQSKARVRVWHLPRTDNHLEWQEEGAGREGRHQVLYDLRGEQATLTQDRGKEFRPYPTGRCQGGLKLRTQDGWRFTFPPLPLNKDPHSLAHASAH